MKEVAKKSSHITVLEIGNTLVKLFSTLLPPSDSGVFFEHYCIEVDATVYAKWAKRLRSGEPGYHLIKWRQRYFIVGREALDEKPSAVPRQNRARLERDYLGIIMASGLLRLFEGNVPEQMDIFVAHPPIDHEVTDTLLRCVLGNWSYECPTTKVTTRIETATPYDEIVGGVMNVSLNPDGFEYDAATVPIGEGPTFVFDLGGGTLDFTRLEKDGTVNYRRIGSRRIGGNQAVERFRALFSQDYPKLVEDTPDGMLPREMVHDILLDQEHSFYTAGEKIVCKDIFKDAFAPLLNEAEQATREFMGGSVGYNNILITGGVSGLLYTEIAEQIFARFSKNKRVFRTDTPSQMFLANAKGGLKMARASLLVQEGKVKSR